MYRREKKEGFQGKDSRLQACYHEKEQIVFDLHTPSSPGAILSRGEVGKVNGGKGSPILKHASVRSRKWGSSIAKKKAQRRLKLAGKIQGRGTVNI